MIKKTKKYDEVVVVTEDLSRVTSLAGLWLRGPPLPETAIKANAKVKRFYSQPGAWQATQTGLDMTKGSAELERGAKRQC